MSRKFLVALDLTKNELQNAVIQNLASAPSSPVKGQLYFNSTGGDNTLYWWDGTTWIPAKATGGAFPGYGTVPAETTFGIAKNDGAASTVARSDHTHGSPTHDNAAHSAINLSALAAAAANISLGGFKITNLGTPTTGTDATTKDYVDNLSAGLAWKDSVVVSPDTNINTASPGSTIDGVTMVAGDRVLLKSQSTGSQNGIWVWAAAASPMTRATDADSETELLGATVFVEEGTNADKAYTMTTNSPITVATTTLTWVQFGAGTAYSAGNGLTLTGSTFDVVAANGSLTVGADNIQVAYAGSGTTFGTAVTAARSDHHHDATYAKVMAQDCAAAATTTVTHNFNTRDVKVEVYRTTTPWDTVDVDVERDTVNSVTVRFATAPAAAAYRIVVEGIDQ